MTTISSEISVETHPAMVAAVRAFAEARSARDRALQRVLDLSGPRDDDGTALEAQAALPAARQERMIAEAAFSRAERALAEAREVAKRDVANARAVGRRELLRALDAALAEARAANRALIAHDDASARLGSNPSPAAFAAVGPEGAYDCWRRAMREEGWL